MSRWLSRRDVFHRRARLSLLAAMSSGLLSACPEKTALWVLQGSVADHLVFAVGKEIGKEAPLTSFPGLWVQTCGSDGNPSRTVWAIEPQDSSEPPHPTRMTYGEPPQGYRSKVAAERLAAGCYDAEIMGTGSVRFVVHSNRTVTVDIP